MGKINLKIKNEIDVCEAKLIAKKIAEEICSDKTIINEILIIVSEMCSNLYKYGGGGEFMISNDDEKIEICTMNNNTDDLPGDALKDGFSTSKSLGIGLGAVRRFADNLEISYEGRLKIKAMKWCKNNRPKVEIAVLSYPYSGRLDENGDGYIVLRKPREVFILLCDVLGHGIHANTMRNKILSYCEENYSIASDFVEFFWSLHYAMRGERGAAIGMAKIYKVNERIKLKYIGLGNVEARLYHDGKYSYLLSREGILGEGTPKIMVEEKEFNKGLLLMWTDGLSRHLELKSVDMNPVEIAHVLMEKYNKNIDDATILVAKIL